MDLSSHTICIVAADSDADELGHVNNAVYLGWVEACCREHALRVGVPTERMLEMGVVPVVRRHVIDYRRSARPGDELEVSTRITRVRGPLASRHNEVRRGGGGELLVEVASEWVWIEPSSGKPKGPPEEVVRAFGFAPRGGGA